MSERGHPSNVYRGLAADAASQAHVPYSRRREAVVLVLEDGRWIPGVRVESASFSLTIPPLLNAVTTAAALGIDRVIAAVASRPFRAHERTYAAGTVRLAGLVPSAADVLAESHDLPLPDHAVSPYITPGDAGAIRRGVPDGRATTVAAPANLLPGEAVALARILSARAYVPESDFRVACLLEIADTGYIPGVNVEHKEWTNILCAERNALGTAVSYGLTEISNVYLTCRSLPGCTPCGACRQLLAELAPTSTLWMDGGDDPLVASDPLTLLPGFFAGNRLSSNP